MALAVAKGLCCPSGRIKRTRGKPGEREEVPSRATWRGAQDLSLVLCGYGAEVSKRGAAATTLRALCAQHWHNVAFGPDGILR